MTDDAQPPAPAAPATDPVRRMGGAGWRSQLLIAVLCVALGFAIVTQVRQTQGDELASMRQDDLVRLLDEITQRNESLAEDAENLRLLRSQLLSGSAASQSAEEYLELQSVLAGTVPVEGPGIVVTVTQTAQVRAQDMVHMLEELRNAGAEAIELSGVRIVAGSYFVESDGALMVDGVALGDTHEWRVIGDPATLTGALGIPGGALASFRSHGAEVDISERELADGRLVQITAIRPVTEPEFASPAPTEG